ncbi:hypothetical protein [Luteolibacter luteus]|uniref:Uncharacterized protein n=1 Tax=Luteolibacter luteus TaxID=2728835 RepID=A0A858RPK5_9BACT|nr:hypothetical protein [Luteolibacter luteus]QJE98792.1 hypothetical protein HHL09_24435 [Luteolibacter luteus]
MDPEFQDLENTLKGMRPAKPDAASLDRLLAAVEGRLQSSPVSISGVESKLASLQPVALSDDLAARMLATVSRVPFPVDEKVVLFPGAQKPAKKENVSRRPWYAAAAAVAVAGAFSALMVGGPKVAQPHHGGGAVAGNEIPLGAKNISAANFTPSSMGSGLQDVSDMGVRWTREGRPVRLYRVIYRDKAQLKNNKGEIIEVEKPRAEYFLVPEKID